jgi:hypothetical protein
MEKFFQDKKFDGLVKSRKTSFVIASEAKQFRNWTDIKEIATALCASQ